MSSAHGGDIGLLARRAGLPPDRILDFSASLNPLGPPEQLRSLVNRGLSTVTHYPDPYSGELAAAIAAHHGLAPDHVVVGNGSTEILFTLPRVLGAKRAVIPVPSYADYQAAAHLAGLAVEQLPLDRADGFAWPWRAIETALRGDEMVVLGQPNNPTGLMSDGDRLLALADRHPDTWFVVDEAFADFVEGYRSLIHARRKNIVVVRSLTKFYAIAGLRLGYALADPEFSRGLRSFLPPWSVGTLAQCVGIGVLADAAYRQTTLREVVRLRQRLAHDLGRLRGVTVYPGRANFLLARLEGALDAVALEEKLLAQGIAIRVCANFAGLDNRYFRVAVRTDDENRRLLEALAGILAPEACHPEAERKTCRARQHRC
jgi:L-threonine-O-3-phosphate decarboxylase